MNRHRQCIILTQPHALKLFLGVILKHIDSEHKYFVKSRVIIPYIVKKSESMY